MLHGPAVVHAGRPTVWVHTTALLPGAVLTVAAFAAAGLAARAGCGCQLSS